MKSLRLAGCLALWTSLGACSAASVDSRPEIPLPAFATAVEERSQGDQHLERFFMPGPEHTLEEVRSFYGQWADEAGWRKIGTEEEAWSTDSWQEFLDGPEARRVRQFLVHWVDPSASWSLRLAMRVYPESGERGAWVIVAPFFNLDAAVWEVDEDRAEAPPEAASAEDVRPETPRAVIRLDPVGRAPITPSSNASNTSVADYSGLLLERTPRERSPEEDLWAGRDWSPDKEDTSAPPRCLDLWDGSLAGRWVAGGGLDGSWIEIEPGPDEGWQITFGSWGCLLEWTMSRSGIVEPGFLRLDGPVVTYFPGEPFTILHMVMIDDLPALVPSRYVAALLPETSASGCSSLTYDRIGGGLFVREADLARTRRDDE